MHRSMFAVAAIAVALLSSCGKSGGSGSKLPVIVSFSAAPAAVAPGASCALSWDVRGAKTVTLDRGIGAVSGSTRTVNPSETTTYTLTATNDAGVAHAIVTVNVRPLPTITSFTADPSTVSRGTAATLSWSVADADTVTIDNGVGTVAGSSTSVSPASTTTYTLVAANAAGTATASTTVPVVEQPVISAFRAEPSNIAPGRTAVLTWKVAGAETVSLDHGIGNVSGESMVVSPAATTTYTLLARNSAGETRAIATTTVSSIESVQLSDAVVTAGGQRQLAAIVVPGEGSPVLDVDWSLAPGCLGTLSPARGATTTYAAPLATGTYTVTATSVWDPTESATATVSVTGVPRVDRFEPPTAAPGASVRITGTAFTAARAVRFNGLDAASFSVASDGEITAIVPAGATKGPISVTTPDGTRASFDDFYPLGTLDLVVDSALVTQSTQTYFPSVPLVAGRAGWLRVFVRANEDNVVRPDVQVRLIEGGSTTFVTNVAARRARVPTITAEGDATSSWNLLLSPSDLVASSTLRLQITVDPANAIPELDETNNTFVLDIPASPVPPLRITLVPIVLASGVGDPSVGTKDKWVDFLGRMFPIASMDVQVGAPFTPSVMSVADSASWSRVLSELDAKRAVEAPARYYYGAIPPGDTGWYSGLGYIGWPTAIGLDSRYWNYADTFAHELGHNFGRYHAPCGGPSGVDASWPTASRYADALIGTWGWDARPDDASPEQMKRPTQYYDVMSYCSPTWTSDYTYQGVLAFRRSREAADAAEPTDSLLVWGSDVAGEVELRPAFRVRAVPTNGTGEYAVEVRDAAGKALRRATFDWVEVGDAADGARHFAVTVPVSGVDDRQIDHVVVVRGARELARAARQGAANSAPHRQEPRARRAGPRAAVIEWDHSAHRAVMVRDARSGEVLGFGADGIARIESAAPELELVLSDGVSSERRTLRVSDAP